MWANFKYYILLIAVLHTEFSLAQSDYSKYRLFDSGYVDFTSKNTRFVNRVPFELPWLYQRKYDSVDFMPVGTEQANRYTFIQDTLGTLRYYADHAGVYSNRSGILFKSYQMNRKVPVPGCWPSDSFYRIPNATKFMCGTQIQDTLENFGYSNCVRFGKTNSYGVGIWDYQNNGFRLLRLSYDSIRGDRIISSSILTNAGKFTTITCGPNDSTFWVVTMLKNRHTIQVFLWTFRSLQFNQSIEIGDTSYLKAYAHRMKFSPDNSKMVLMKRYKNSTDIFGDQSNPKNTSYLFDFDSQRGILFNRQKIKIYGNQLEFSPDSKYLYIKHTFSTMDSNYYLIKPSNAGYLSRFTLSTNSAQLLQKKSTGFLYSLQLLQDGNIYWPNTIGGNTHYVFERLENCNDTQTVNFNTYISDIDVINGFRFRPSSTGYCIYPEILTCKCYESESKPAKINSCDSDTLVIQNYFKKYDSLSIDWGDGSYNVYKQLDSTFKHGYSRNGQYVVNTNYRSVFQEFTKIDTLTIISHKPLNIAKDTFFCPYDTFSIDLINHDSNLVWRSTALSHMKFTQTGKYRYHYKEHWCNFEDSIHVLKRNSPWAFPFNDTIICQGNIVKVIVPINLKLQWNNNPKDTVHTKYFSASGLQSVQFSDGICNYGDSLSVEIAPKMNFEVVQVDTTVCHQFSDLLFQIQGDVSKMKSIIWNSEITNDESFFTRHLDKIQITVIDSFGCSEKAYISPLSKCNSFIFIPNAFTPNGSGPEANEYFRPIIKNGQLKSFKIYNRWGEILFDNPNNQGWNGTYQNMNSPEGVYIYETEIVTNFKGSTDVQRYRGNFHLIR